MKTFKKFACPECGGLVELAAAKGRTIEYTRGYHVPVPDEFLIPTCTRCDEIFVVGEIEDELYPVLERRFLEMQAAHYRELVEILVRRHGVKIRDIVRACAVTPAYMSHVLNGKRAASTTLTRLLEAFVACGSEFVRHLEGRQWSPLRTGLYAVRMPQIQDSAKKAAWSAGGSAVNAQWAADGHIDGPGSTSWGQAA